MDGDILLPKATVVKAVKERLPAGDDLKVSPAANELILECCTALIQILATTANSISEKSKRSTITPEDILAAATELGFEKYTPSMAEALEAFKSEAKDKRDVKRSKKQNKNTGMTEEELIEMQNKLFAQAAQKQMEGA
jgi:DNA polymerase epsilon subunit 3